MREVYLDHAATTPTAPEVLEAMRPFMGERFGNASSVHHRGEDARHAIATARASVAALAGSAPEEVVFVASGTEANNLALVGVLEAAPPGRNRLIVSAVEHPSVLETARYLERRGWALTIAPVDRSGRIDSERLRGALGPDVALVSLMSANNETGALQPVAEIAALAHASGALVHTDAVQAAGKVPLSLADLGVDLISISAHKLNGPLGAGALIVRRRTRLEPLLHGGHQERARRAGTENLPAIVGFGVAAGRALAQIESEPARVRALSVRLWRGLEGRIPGLSRNGDPEWRVAGILNVGIRGIDGEAVLHELDLAGVTISTGSACSAGEPGPSHVLIAMGLGAEEAHASVRFSLGFGNDEGDVERVIEVLPPIVERLRAMGRPGLERSA